jgi:DNA-binding CsgD family transcriptional regulator
MDDLLRFVERAICFEQVPDARLLGAAHRFAEECGLTPRELEVVVLALGQRPKLHDALGVSLNTLKTLVKSILKKTGHDSLHSLSTAIMRETLQGR